MTTLTNPTTTTLTNPTTTTLTNRTTNPAQATTTEGTDRARPVLHPDLIEPVAQLEAASNDVTALAKDADTAGLARRRTKLARQLDAAAKLTRRGVGRDVPACARQIPYLARRATHTTDLSSTDATITAASALITALHEWRGHTASVPADRRA